MNNFYTQYIIQWLEIIIIELLDNLEFGHSLAMGQHLFLPKLFTITIYLSVAIVWYLTTHFQLAFHIRCE